MAFRKILCPLFLVTSFLFWQGCAALPTADQLETWKANTDKALAAAGALADKAKAAGDAAVAKIDELKAAQVAQLDKIEAVAGALDSDGDGKVTAAEAKATIGKLTTAPGGWSLLMDPATYAAVLAALAGFGVTKRVGAAAVRAAISPHVQTMIDANGDGVPDDPASAVTAGQNPPSA